MAQPNYDNMTTVLQAIDEYVAVISGTRMPLEVGWYDYGYARSFGNFKDLPRIFQNRFHEQLEYCKLNATELIKSLLNLYEGLKEKPNQPTLPMEAQKNEHDNP